jgi:FkbM family methyltransferase
MGRLASEIFERTLHLLRKRSADPQAVIHIGAYNGKQAKGYAAVPNVTVYAIEACKANFAFLKQVIAGHSNILPVRAALTDADGPVEFFVVRRKGSVGSSQANTLFKEHLSSKSWAKDIKCLTVDGMTLDTFCVRYSIGDIALIRMNCEGGEYKILDPRLPLLALERAWLLDVSFHGKSNLFVGRAFSEHRSRIDDMLKQKGFRMIKGKLAGSGHLDQLWERK